MINFATLQGLSIPEGKVVEIKDAAGRVIWAVQNGKPAVLEVAKVTSDVYTSSATYSGEQFILLDIYPKTNGSVKITYGGLTKIITDTSGVEEPAAQQVFFGTFKGLSDSITIPSSGTLTIEGGYVGFAAGSYNTAKNTTTRCDCVTAIKDTGDATKIPTQAFYYCTSALKSVTISDSVTEIGNNAFRNCLALNSVVIGNGLTKIPESCFRQCTALTNVVIGNGVEEIGSYSFHTCNALTSITIPSNVTYFVMHCFTLTNNYSRKIYMMSTTPATVYVNASGNASAFDAAGTNNIIVPKGCGTVYKSAAGWSQYANYITEAS